MRADYENMTIQGLAEAGLGVALWCCAYPADTILKCIDLQAEHPRCGEWLVSDLVMVFRCKRCWARPTKALIVRPIEYAATMRQEGVLAQVPGLWHAEGH